MSFSEVEIHAQFTLNQGRIEEITMKEDIITNNFIGDDGFGDMFEGDLEPELARAGTALDDEPLYQSNDISKISTIDDGQPRTIIDSTLERSKLGTHDNSMCCKLIFRFSEVCVDCIVYLD